MSMDKNSFSILFLLQAILFNLPTDGTAQHVHFCQDLIDSYVNIHMYLNEIVQNSNWNPIRAAVNDIRENHPLGAQRS